MPAPCGAHPSWLTLGVAGAMALPWYESTNAALMAAWIAVVASVSTPGSSSVVSSSVTCRTTAGLAVGAGTPSSLPALARFVSVDELLIALGAADPSLNV